MEEKKVIKVEDIKKEAEEKGCPVQRALYYVEEFLAGPMCGRCFPCAMGSYEAKLRLQAIIDRQGKEDDITALRRIADDMLVSSFCKKGKDTARFMLEWLDSGVFQEHINGVCPDAKCVAYVQYKIIADKCILCGECKAVCKDHAILGHKRKGPFSAGDVPFEIRDKRCTRCGACIDVCPTGAIVLIESKTGRIIEEREPKETEEAVK